MGPRTDVRDADLEIHGSLLSEVLRYEGGNGRIGRSERIESPAERRTLHPGRFIGSAVGSVVKHIGRKNMSRAIIGTSVAVLIFGGMSAKGQTPKSPELKVLDRFVGSWRGESVERQANGDEKKSSDTSVTKWSLQGRYIEVRATDSDGKEGALELWTYDSDAGVYKMWFFGSNSPKPRSLTWRWNESKKTLTSVIEDMGNGITMQMTVRFIGHDRYEYTGTGKDASGNVVFETTGKVFRK